MIINMDILRKDTIKLIKQIDEQIAQVQGIAAVHHCEPSQLRDEHGGWVLTPLLQAKATAYSTLVMLQTQK